MSETQKAPSLLPLIAKLVGVMVLVLLVAVLAVLALTGVQVRFWPTHEMTESQQQMHDEATRVLSLAAEGRYEDVSELLATSCPRLQPQSPEQLDFFFRGFPFEFELNRVRQEAATNGRVSGRLDGDTYAHIVGVQLERDDESAPWRVCTIAVAGYT